jgi:serine/threonine protein kinase
VDHSGTPAGEPIRAASRRERRFLGSVREDLSRLADPDLTASLVQVAAARPDDDPYRTVGGASLGAPSTIGTRFRVVRPHARGGLGEVFLARDTELNRDVALKEIQDRYADDPRYRSRFAYEAEVTGGLEHSGIVPVYGLGHTADGRPFYAMRFIRGDSLKDAVRRFHQAESQPRRDPGEHALELRELLGRFVDVCDAVAYARSRGVLHRDLKPGNIMLGRYGSSKSGTRTSSARPWTISCASWMKTGCPIGRGLAHEADRRRYGDPVAVEPNAGRAPTRCLFGRSRSGRPPGTVIMGAGARPPTPARGERNRPLCRGVWAGRARGPVP